MAENLPNASIPIKRRTPENSEDSQQNIWENQTLCLQRARARRFRVNPVLNNGDPKKAAVAFTQDPHYNECICSPRF